MKINRGFTLIEIIVAVAILTIILAFGVSINFNAYTRGIFQSEESKVVSSLERMRSQALNNVCIGSTCTDGKKHGLCYDSGSKKYIMFQGNTYTTRDSSVDISMDANSNITISAIPNILLCSTGSGIVFNQLTGKLFPLLSPATNEVDINVDDGTGLPKHIKINNEGRINW
jgi:prepilin-type N-terminal cleavage/methylation domain-containing protein